MELAQFAAEKANGIAEDTGDTTREPLSKLYSGLSDISGQDVLAAQEKLASIPESELSPRDLALRNAAKTIAEQIMQPPSLAAATTVSSSSGPATEGSRAPVPARKTEEAASQAADAAPLKTFFDKNRARLNEIDSMLKQEGG
jgi:chemotaxis protein MotC